MNEFSMFIIYYKFYIININEHNFVTITVSKLKSKHSNQFC